jgi:hypothetical protein
VERLTRSSAASLGRAVFSIAKSLLSPKLRRYLQGCSWVQRIGAITQGKDHELVIILAILLSWSFLSSSVPIFAIWLLLL